MAFFGGAFSERVRAFSRAHQDANVRLEVVTLNGERLDALELSAVESGTRVSTRDNRLVFLPYSLIAYVDVAILQDHRIAGFQLLLDSDERLAVVSSSRSIIHSAGDSRTGQAFGPRAASTSSSDDTRQRQLADFTFFERQLRADFVIERATG